MANKRFRPSKELQAWVRKSESKATQSFTPLDEEVVPENVPVESRPKTIDEVIL